MVDVHDNNTRSRNMAAIKSKDTRPEMVIRKGLFARGYRYSLHKKSLPGKPDLVLKKYQTVIFVNGCFWHMHNCHMFRLPKSRADFWVRKLEENKRRDNRAISDLIRNGWRVIIVWECALKGRGKIGNGGAISMIETILSDQKLTNTKKNLYEIRGYE